MIDDKELQPIEIDLDVASRGEITESFLGMFGASLKLIMQRMFGGGSRTAPVTIKGTKQQIADFAKTLGSEKKYIKTAAKFGLDDPRTYKDKFKLKQMIRKFESSTKLKWPFK